MVIAITRDRRGPLKGHTLILADHVPEVRLLEKVGITNRLRFDIQIRSLVPMFQRGLSICPLMMEDKSTSYRLTPPPLLLPPPSYHLDYRLPHRLVVVAGNLQ